MVRHMTAPRRVPAHALTTNDRRVLAAIERSCVEYDGFGPHGSADWTAIRRLAARWLVDTIGHGACQTCRESHEGLIYVLTEQGRAMQEARHVEAVE
jgi:hypothetical protein